MKKLIYFLLLSGIFVFSACKSEGTKEKTEEDAKEETVDKKDKKSSLGNKCDDFLADYGKWVEGYLKFLVELKDNQGDVTLTSKAVEWAEEAMKWADDYDNLVDCIKDTEFTAKYMDLVEKINAASAELYTEP